jgi:LCP family protein required for cell wall assembly
MDVSRFKRRDLIQKQRQTTEITFGSTAPVPKAVPVRPHSMAEFVVQSADVRPTHSIDGVKAPISDIAPRRRPALEPAPAPIQTPTPLEMPVSSVAVQDLPPIDMELPGDSSRLRGADNLIKDGKWAKTRRIAFRSTAAMMTLVVIAGGVLFSQGYFKVHQAFKGNAVTAAGLKTNVNPDLLKGEGAGRVNILLLGRGGGTHDAPDLTDTLILASVDPVNHTTALFSIPRDLWVDVPNQGVSKINAVWETGVYKYLGKRQSNTTNSTAIQAGFDSIDQTVENVMGVSINYNMMFDFSAFKQAVDTVDGVTVNVPSDLIDPTMAWENGNNSVLAKAGTQVFDGKHALIYARSRETSSDFARGQRQRQLLLAIKNKVDTIGTLSNPLKISGLINAFGSNVSTDLSLSNASRLYSIMKKVTDGHITSAGLADAPNSYVTTGNMNGQSIVLPKAGLFNYGAIQTFVRTQLKDPYILKENARILVLNGTTQAGLATTKAAELKSYGYNIMGTDNAPTTSYGASYLVDLSHGKKKYTSHYLEQRFNLNATKTLPDPAIQATGADFVIILGSDEQTPNSP